MRQKNVPESPIRRSLIKKSYDPLREAMITSYNHLEGREGDDNCDEYTQRMTFVTQKDD